jgi:DNA polymerase V
VPGTFGLIDGNAFYCSCERAFSPRLRGRAVVVLSNNDGCAIARTAEAEAVGVRMGDPWHLARNRPAVRAARVEWFSSNYALYGDMSRRMYQVLADRVPRVEPYSIDEMFLDLDVPGDLLALARDLRAAVLRVAKMPTCVGIGPTKTIAKLANALAKDSPELAGVCDLRCERERMRRYERLPVSEVWGIGGRTTEKLAALGVDTVARFLAMPQRDARNLLTVVGARVQAELRGVSCLPLSMVAPTRKGVAVTRSFGRPVTAWADMREALAHHTARAGEKLRAEGLVAGRMMVFLHTNPHNGDPWHSAQHGGRIEPTADTGALIGEAVRMLRPLWRQGYRYAKAGVVLDDLRDAAMEPRSLFPTRDPNRSARLMAALDAVNVRFGRGALRPLSTGLARPWSTRHARLSPRYTTRADELMEAKAW